MSDDNEEPVVEKSKRAPRWLRVVLTIVLILFVAFAFFLNNRHIIERINQ